MTRRTTINHENIRILSEQLFDEDIRKAFAGIADQIISNIETGASNESCVETVRESISSIDNAIGGTGINGLLVPTTRGYTGEYPIEERSIHRPLQYALGHLLMSNWPRDAVRDSCQHIEGILKAMFAEEIHDIRHRPLGQIVRDIKRRKLLGNDLIQQLETVVPILNIAKHEHGNDAVKIPDPFHTLESQVFNRHEAVSMYFICRKLGVLLQADLNLPQGSKRPREKRP